MWYRLARLLRHRWTEDSDRVFTRDALQRLTDGVASSEKKHTGEIRICIEAGLPNRMLLQDLPAAHLTRQRALAQFGLLQVWDTEHNNGVLIYLLLAEHAIELVADRGLNQHVTPEVWAAVVQRLGTALQAGQFEEGLDSAVQEVSALLEKYFVHLPGARNPNELADHPVLL